MLRRVKTDLHIHTCLSPCGELNLSPRGIVKMAKEKDIEIIGICDHNSAENIPALITAGERFSLPVIPGIEVTTKEEIHLLALFGRAEAAFNLQEKIYEHLPGENNPELYGLQVVVNEEGEVLRFNTHLLIGATTLSLEETVSLIHELGGLAIASHIDREAFSLIGQLGFIPPGLALDGLEVSPRLLVAEARKKFPGQYPLLTFSDAHDLKEIGTATTSFLMTDLTFEEIVLSLQQRGGRKILN